jgi:hypothetical protein
MENKDLGKQTCKDWVYPQSKVEPDDADFTPIIQVKPSAIKITQLRPGEISIHSI